MENNKLASARFVRKKTAFARTLGKQVVELPYYTFLYAWALFSIFTLVWLLYTSFKSNKELFADVWSLPTMLHWENYYTAWVLSRMGSYFMNSVLVMSESLLFIAILACPAAYVLARRKFFGNSGIVMLFLAGLGVPIQLLIVPLYLLLSKLHLTNSLQGLILVYTSISLPFTIFLLIGFFKTIPTELDESAAIDGATETKAFVRIMLPLALPGIMTAIILNFISLWSEYLLAMVLLSDESKRPLSLGVYSLKDAMTYSADWVSMFAGVSILMVPSIIIFALLSERIASGMTVGALKG